MSRTYAVLHTQDGKEVEVGPIEKFSIERHDKHGLVLFADGKPLARFVTRGSKWKSPQGDCTKIEVKHLFYVICKWCAEDFLPDPDRTEAATSCPEEACQAKDRHWRQGFSPQPS